MSEKRISTAREGSKIQLTKSEDALDILIPPSGLDTSLIFIALFAVAWNAGIFAWTIGALDIPSPLNIVLTLFSLPFWGVGVFMVYWVLFCLFGKTRLRLNQYQMSLTYELFGAKFHNIRPEAPSQLIANTGSIKSEVELRWLAREISDWLAPIDSPLPPDDLGGTR